MPSEVAAATTDLLGVAVEALGGQTRDGQVRMANAVANAIDTGEHLAVQAGTGTGKSLAYLVPAIAHATESGKTVVVSTATIALQRQLVERDLPRVTAALAGPLGNEPTFAILKGRSNYLCLNKIHGNVADEPDTELFDAFELSRTGREVTRLREWVSDTETGDRDDLAPGVSDRSWRQVSVTARECLGAANCSFSDDCFAERARQVAAHSDVVVTNHAMLAIDALSPATILPDHDVVVIDEAHELSDRITSVATDELSAASVALAARRAAKLIDEELVDDVVGGGELLGDLLDDAAPRLLTGLPTGWDAALASLRDRMWRARSGIGPVRSTGATDGDAAAARSAALTSLEELHDAAVRVLTAFDEPDPAKRRDVVWLAEEKSKAGTRKVLRIAPLSVGGLLRASLFANATVILTSATLVVGGSFDALATTWGLPVAGNQARAETATEIDVTATGKPVPSDDGPWGEREGAESFRWRGLDAGSPFDYPRSAILYVAKHLPPPGRGGLSDEMLAELAGLMAAARGRTLGLFSSMRAAREAAEALRERTDHAILCQGEDSTSTLVRRFSEDPETSLFGTLSLWQGVDVPGPSLSLVVIDRIPFPRPDDPLASARARAVEAAGGNGFMSVSANHAALLLAQGAGRLLRSTSDRGVVAVLDSRLATARYGNYLVASLPPFWKTTDSATVLSALDRLTS
ncbi:ATP-dependent DNA helicase DinG [Gordonia araii NBRC 100433]|uniref:ATP-dependent helicase DinG n=1 Tax=Gordonia araii NBRC 100433 TaxID=1073574 RepID=G7GX20_9ACTN|nr:ATP-dependent DNA helicase [Gordonia araii]NNG99152.1 ATP-dependent DNA helicase [Gordonia araii NBRC 100433]GAB08145.1 ATP-dependent DNA helicase DinG [Gordonia araii NBRC 100433]